MTLVQTASAVASFTCQFSGDPRPSSVSWQYVSVTRLSATVLISPGGQYSINTTTINGNAITSILTISYVTVFNDGVYLCFGNNGGPPATGRSLLSVIGTVYIVCTVTQKMILTILIQLKIFFITIFNSCKEYTFDFT